MEIKLTIDLSDRAINAINALVSITSSVAPVEASPMVEPKAKKPRAKKVAEPENPTPTVTTLDVPETPAIEVSQDGLVTGTPDVQVDIPPATETPVTRNSVIQSLTRLAPAGFTDQCKTLIQKYSTNERKDLAGVPANKLTELKAELDALAPQGF